MIFLFLPFIFSPFTYAIRRLPALYLASWPVIIQTLGRDALITHATVLLLYILACDITRGAMLKLIGIDLISLPVGMALLATLMTENGLSCLSYITPIFNILLLIAEPIIFIIETKIVLDMIRAFNKWISNIRDDYSDDFTDCETSSSKALVLTRFVVVLLAMACYIGTYIVIQELKVLLGFEDGDLPVRFSQVVGLLVTLQLITFSATIYKKENVLSETVIVSLIASVPIAIAASSYHLKSTNANSSSNGQMLRGLALQMFKGFDLTGTIKDKLTRYYFGYDFWCILGFRLACFTWWNHYNSYRPSVVKIIFVLAYTQMLIQQIENKAGWSLGWCLGWLINRCRGLLIG